MVDKSAQRVLALMKTHRLSFAKIGEIAGCSAQAAQKWSTGGRISEERLSRLAKHFGLTVAELRYGSADGEPKKPTAEELRGSYNVAPIPTGAEIGLAFDRLPEAKRRLYAAAIFQDAALVETVPWLNFSLPITKSYHEFVDKTRQAVQEQMASQLPLDLS